MKITRRAAILAADYLVEAEAGRRSLHEDAVLFAFLTSTDLAAAAETGAAPRYEGLFHPHETACANMLSAAYAPQADARRRAALQKDRA